MAHIKNLSLHGLVLVGALAVPPARAAGLSLNYGGRLVDASGAGVDGPVDLDLNFYDAAEGGNKLGTSPYAFASVALSHGVFEVLLNIGTDINSLFPDPTSATWIEVTDKTHGKTYPRQKFSAVPYALKIPVDGTSLVYDSNGNLSVKAVPSTSVTGLSDALATKASTTQSLAGDVSGNLGASIVSKIRGVNVSAATPTAGQVLSFASGQWQPQTLSQNAGTVTSVGVTPPLAVTNAATTPALSLAQANSAANGYLSSTDWLVFNAKQNALGYAPLNKAGDTMSGALNMNSQTLTNLAAPVNASDAATKTYIDTATGLLLKKDGSTPLTSAWAVGNDLTSVGNVGLAAQKTLLLGTYAGSQETSLTATLASADRGRTWFNSATNQIKFWDGSAVQTLGVSGAGLTSLNGQSGGAQTFASGTSGTTPNWSSATNTHTLNIPMASAGSVTAGLLSNADYAAFNGKIGTVAAGTGLSVATTGSTATVSLANAGTAGTYTKVTTNAQGQVTSGSTLAAGDIPSLDASKISTGQIPVVSGGTGATTAALARGNLSAAASGANSDITSLTGLTTALSVGQGGTGATTAALARGNLSAAASGANSDITSLTGLTTALSVGQGGTGTTATPANGQLTIGNGTNYTLATLTSGTGITITNAAGAITVAATADASTKVSKAGDTMTGALNLPANGLIAGTNQLVISSGYVGIGTTTPSSNLHLVGAPTAYTTLTVQSNGGAGNGYGAVLNLQNTNASVAKMQMADSGSGTTYYAEPNYLTLSTQSGYGMKFNTNAADNNGLRITSAGNVGIGTTAPKGILDLGAPGSMTFASMGVEGSYLGFNTYYNGGWKYKANGMGSILRQDTSGLQIWSAPSNGSGNDAPAAPVNAMTITPSGNVGIGTTAPSSALAINTGSLNGLTIGANGTTKFRFGQTEVADDWQIRTNAAFGAPSTQDDATKASWALRMGAAGDDFSVWRGAPGFINNSLSNFLTIKSTGNVGIGTTAPAANLEVQNSAANATEVIAKGDYSATVDPAQLAVMGYTNPNQQLQLGYNTTNDYGSIQAIKQGTSAKPLALQPYGGNVGIGTTAPTSTLQVIGPISTGSGAIKWVTYSGTTSASTGSPLAVFAHGLTASNILSVTCNVFYSGNTYYQFSAITGNANTRYTLWNATNIAIYATDGDTGFWNTAYRCIAQTL